MIKYPYAIGAMDCLPAAWGKMNVAVMGKPEPVELTVAFSSALSTEIWNNRNNGTGSPSHLVNILLILPARHKLRVVLLAHGV